MNHCCCRHHGPVRHRRAAKYFMAFAIAVMVTAAAINLYIVL